MIAWPCLAKRCASLSTMLSLSGRRDSGTSGPSSFNSSASDNLDRSSVGNDKSSLTVITYDGDAGVVDVRDEQVLDTFELFVNPFDILVG